MTLECYEYLWNFDEVTGRLTCKRHGLDWRDETGNGAILALLEMACETRDKLQADNARLREVLSRLVTERTAGLASREAWDKARAALGKED